jgi:predicted phosphate transport protein (TIGR00153 family)
VARDRSCRRGITLAFFLCVFTSESRRLNLKVPSLKLSMITRAFRSLMPRDDRFIDRFSQHSKLLVPAAEAFRALMSADGAGGQHVATISRLEHEADLITRETVLAIHKTFITPFDRSQILDLITALDDTIDLMKDTGRRMLRYGVEFTPEMQGMADCAVRATTEIRDAMPFLGAIQRSEEKLNAMSESVRRIEGEADDLLDQGLRALFAGDMSPGYKLTIEKVYDLVEAVVDRCEDVVDVIDGIVIEQV